MANVQKIDIWSVEVDDRPGATSSIFNTLAEAGVDLQFVLARRQPDKPGKGILFVSPIQGGKQETAALRANLQKRNDVVGIRVEGTNAAGVGFRITDALGKAGINLRALAANAIGKQYVAVIACDSPADADKGIQILKSLP